MRFAIVFLLLCSCSASEKIATETNSIGERAGTIERIAERIGTQSKEPDTVASAASIVIEAKAIGRATQEIHAALPGVADTHPYLDTFKWFAIAAAGIAAAWLVHATGLGAFCRIAIGWIPQKKLDDAAMARSAMSEQDPVSIREYIAMKRSDPEWDAAWKKTQPKEEPHV